MGHKRWLQLGTALIVAGFLIGLYGTAASFSSSFELAHESATSAARQAVAIEQSVARAMVWTATGMFTLGMGVVVVVTSLCFRWFVKPPAPNPDDGQHPN